MADTKFSDLPIANNTDTLEYAGLQNSTTVQIPGAAALAQTIRDLGYIPAPIDSPVFTGDPRAPTPDLGDNDTSIATTAFVKGLGFGIGSVTDVTADSPLNSSGGDTPNLTIDQASTTTDGYLSQTDWDTFNNKVSDVTATAPLASSGGTNPDISVILPNDPTVFLDGQGNFTSPFVSNSAGWKTVFDFDFSSQSNQTLNADGIYTIGSLVWTKGNSANDNVAMAVVNGSGLVIQPKSTSNWLGTTRTAPYLEIDMSTVVNGFYVDSPISIWLYVAADNVTATGDSIGIFMDNFGDANTGCQAGVSRGVVGGVKSIFITGYIGPSPSGTQSVASATNNTDRVITNVFPTGRYSGTRTNYRGAYAGTWPAYADIVPKLRGVATTLVSQTDSQNIITGLPMKLVLTVMRNGSGTALSGTIGRIRIDVR